MAGPTQRTPRSPVVCLPAALSPRRVTRCIHERDADAEGHRGLRIRESGQMRSATCPAPRLDDPGSDPRVPRLAGWRTTRARGQCHDMPKATKAKTSNGTSFVPSTAASSRDSLATMVNPSQAWVVPLSFPGNTPSKVSPTKAVPVSLSTAVRSASPEIDQLCAHSQNPDYAEMLDEDNIAWGAPARRWWKRV
ncbi:hypothetical protein EVG20_g8588 [Dentipellis fragilis]|uniref:Uncharacterized protein n=1 Tax=Dentipellis fragilis TaxID=205917 RepID=A0A4Y9Y4P4_9AGAM|nr:hypothetical protein EVG20_g8588 [Dentipellis fragilis]